MQSTDDGEFYPDKNLDRSYKIPRRGPGDYNPSSSRASVSNSKRNQIETPLADSYYNFPYDPRAATAYYQYIPGCGNLPGQVPPHRGTFNYGTPHLPSRPINNVDPIKKNIYDTLRDIKEKPKNYGNNIFQQTVPDLLDDSLPKDLKLQFQPLFCKLCSAQLSSNQTAKMHYKSKNHEKKIRKWLIEWSEKTGAPLPKRALPSGEKKDENAEKNPEWFHCNICDLELTGRMHAESHYMGKNHQNKGAIFFRALLGHKTPAGHGYFDKDGKWVRVKGQKSKLYDFERGEDNFGMDFKKSQETATAEDASNGAPPAKKKKEAQPTTNFHCEVCNVYATCQEQLDTHFSGQKHVKKLKQVGLDSYAAQRKLIETNATSAIIPSTALSIPISPHEPDMNLSVYRTPSGDYYCPTCNLTTNSEPQFIQHMKSKGHAKKAAQKKLKSGH